LKISRVLEIPSIKILLYLLENGEVRYTDLAKLISSRGALSLNLKALETEGLLSRRVVTTKPIHSYYALTEKGKRIAHNFLDTKQTLA
jgi:DNA-binding HxlR family transcriptional regulator